MKARAMPKSVMTTRPSVRDEHVVGLEIAVNHAGRVRAGEARADRPRRSRRTRASGSAPSRATSAPSDSPSTSSIVRNLLALVLADVEDARHVVVRDPPRELHLAAEALEDARRVDESLAEHLEGDDLVELAVARAVDAAHPADAEQAEDLVAVGEQRAARAREDARPRLPRRGADRRDQRLALVRDRLVLCERGARGGIDHRGRA